MDAFYVSVELRRRPELRGKPVVVGGTGSRGVVAAASYEARRYGIHSAMPGAVARRLCPAAVFLPGDHELYSQVSRQINEIFHEATPYVEPLSLDEAFLDVTGSLRLLGEGVVIAKHIRERIASQLDLTCSVGVAPNKFLAKLASVAAKPKASASGIEPGLGVFEVLAGRELEFLLPLPVQALWGVGPATLERLSRLGVKTVSDLNALGEGVVIAKHVRERIASQLDLTCSVGVAPNKFLAKLASVAAKPKASASGIEPGLGVFEVLAGRELEFLLPLPVQALWGVGPATLERLSRLGVKTVSDLNALGEATLVSALGKASGRHLYALSCGRDERGVETNRATKSIGHEETFARDLHDVADLHTELVRLSDGVASRLRAAGFGARTLTLKVRFAGFTTITRSTTLPSPVATAAAIVSAVAPLLASIDPSSGVRLVGVHASNFGPPVEQLQFDDLFADDQAPAPADWIEASAAIDAIRERFGDSAIGPASAVSTRGLRLVRRGAQQWGPDHDTPVRGETASQREER